MSNLFGTKNSQWKDPNRTRTEETRRRWLNQISCPPGMMTIIIDHPRHKPEKPNEQRQSEKKFQKKQIAVSSRRGETQTHRGREREREKKKQLTRTRNCQSKPASSIADDLESGVGRRRRCRRNRSGLQERQTLRRSGRQVSPHAHTIAATAATKTKTGTTTTTSSDSPPCLPITLINLFFFHYLLFLLTTIASYGCADGGGGGRRCCMRRVSDQARAPADAHPSPMRIIAKFSPTDANNTTY
jgi:hypothetical protein